MRDAHGQSFACAIDHRQRICVALARILEDITQPDVIVPRRGWAGKLGVLPHDAGAGGDCFQAASLTAIAKIFGLRLDGDVAEFAGHAVAAVQIPAVDYDTRADTLADLDVDTVIATLRAAQPPFGQNI